jgi:hypothetical protein
MSEFWWPEIGRRFRVARLVLGLSRKPRTHMASRSGHIANGRQAASKRITPVTSSVSEKNTTSLLIDSFAERALAWERIFPNARRARSRSCRVLCDSKKGDSVMTDLKGDRGRWSPYCAE